MHSRLRARVSLARLRWSVSLARSRWSAALAKGPTRTRSSGPPPLPFLNRCKEVAELTSHFQDDPAGITVLLGPPSSGKTALVQHVLTQTDASGSPLFNPLTVDLHSVDTSSKPNFVAAFVKQTQRGPDFWKGFTPSKISFKDWAIEFRRQESASVSSAIFASIAEKCQKNWRQGCPPPVLVIEEAHEFRRLEKVDSGTLDAFLKFAVRVSKQDRTLHIIFTSSDSFFANWLTERISPMNFEVDVIGDLPKHEAEAFFTQLLEISPTMTPAQRQQFHAIPFDQVFHMTGGRMFLIKRYMSQHCRRGPIQSASDFKPVQLARTDLRHFFLTDSTEYTKKQVLEIVQALLASPGYLDYHECIDRFGWAVIRAMVEDKLLYYRPMSTFARDLTPVPEDDVLTAPSVPALRAMETLVKL
ncbi:hypothetical protein HK104_000957 [Borealophlyctis nickersoniae]|nr:hypothetical protein HK104_000957 [Borealophlyctis nickersoniae]